MIYFCFHYTRRLGFICFFFFSSRRRHTRSLRDWSSDVCSSDLLLAGSRRMMKHQLWRDIAEEWRGRQGARLAAPGALQGATEEQPVLCTRHGDLEQAALLGIGAAF